MMYTDLLEQYLQHLTTTCSPATVRIYTWVLRHAHQELPAGVVNAGEDELHAWLSQPGRTAKTRDTYRCPIVGLHRWLYRRGHSSYDPGPLIPRIKVGRRLPKPTTDAETAQLLTNARQPIRTWCWVAAYAGARVIELTRISSDDWHPAGILLRGKGDRERVVPMHPALWAVLERLPAGPLVTGRFTDPRHLSSICCTEFRRLGVDGGIHRLRHWFATRTLDGHGNVRTVQELLGHSSLATTQIYTAVSSAAMSEAVAGLPVIGRSSDGEAPGS